LSAGTRAAVYEVYSERSPNVYKVTICLAELDEPWRDTWIDVSRGAQHAPSFLQRAPNGRVPVLIDDAPVDGGASQTVWESAAILMYLAEKHGRFLPSDGRTRTEVLMCVFWQMAGLGPMSGQNAHALQYKPSADDYWPQRYHTEVERLYRVLNMQLRGREWICDEYSIADMACYPWIRMHRALLHDIAELQDLQAWAARMSQRPAVIEAYRRMDLLPRSTATKEQRFQVMRPGDGLAALREVELARKDSPAL
jgi:GST-like protein